MRKIIWILTVTLLISACQKSSTEFKASENTRLANEMISQSESPQDLSALPVDPLQNPEINKKKIIKDGRMTLKVEELDKSKKRVDELVKNNEGYYANESFNNSDYESAYQLKIRIPAGNYEKFINTLESGDVEIVYKEINARDVTDQFIDLETRLNNKRTYLLRYQNLVRQAKNIQEILEIEEKIRGLEEEIESTTGKLKYLGDQVDYSTLDLTISKQKEFKYNLAHRGSFTEKLKQSLSRGWFGLVDFFIFLIKIWPLWIFTTVGYLFWRKRKRRKPANAGR